jgi:hypothetical protein
MSAVRILTVCGALTWLVAASGQAQTTGGAVLAKVDHLVYATPDLPGGVDALEKLLGVRATPGGQHPGRGTHNALIALGPSTYIELIARDPQQPKPGQPRPFGLDDLTTPRLVTWSAKESNLPSLSRRAAARGIVLGELSPGSRRRLDGLLLTWQYTNPRVVIAEGMVPFFIDWGKTPHPAASAKQGGTLVGLRVEHPDPERVRMLLGDVGLDLPVSKGVRPALTAAIDSPRGRVELR